MSKSAKSNLFKKYSQNLEWFKEHPEIQFKPDFTNGCMCPLCLELFFEKDLDPTAENPLTLEHVPPKSLGGKGRLLTCKKCNSTSGHDLDSNLFNRLLEMDFHSFLPNASSKTSFHLNGNQVNGTVKIDNEGAILIDIKKEISDPKQRTLFLKDLIVPRTFSVYNPILNPEPAPQQLTPKFSFRKRNTADMQKASIALLRIAYLYAFSEFGHSFILNGTLSAVRKQIANPNQEILPSSFWVDYEFADEWKGVNIITGPEELRSFLIVFSLSTDSKIRKYAILLPGPSDPGLKIYENICIAGESGFHNAKIYHCGDLDCINYKDRTFDMQSYWQNIEELNQEKEKS
jgi:hypothetical protein